MPNLRAPGRSDKPRYPVRRYGAGVSDLLTAYAARLRAIDPLLEVSTDPPAGEEIAAGSARGWARVIDVDPASESAVWSRLRTYALAPRWSGGPAELDALLTEWVVWLAAQGAPAAGPESQTSITWPSRDVAAARVFYAHGLMPSTTLAVRPRGRATSSARPPAGVTVRVATPEDAGAVVALAAEEVRYETGLSPVTERPGHEVTRRREVAARLAEPEPWTWLAERDGVAVGVLAAERPEASEWAGGLTSARPAAYLGLLSVSPDERGGGVGAALAAGAQRIFDEAGLPASLLHYGTFNPLSVPFWARHGYRPLWTIWATQPAAAQR